MKPNKCGRCGLVLVAGSRHATAEDCLPALRTRYEMVDRERREMARKLPSTNVLAALSRIEQRLNFLVGEKKQQVAQLISDYATTIDEREYPDAVAALLRLRSMLLAKKLQEPAA